MGQPQRRTTRAQDGFNNDLWTLLSEVKKKKRKFSEVKKKKGNLEKYFYSPISNSHNKQKTKNKCWPKMFCRWGRKMAASRWSINVPSGLGYLSLPFIPLRMLNLPQSGAHAGCHKKTWKTIWSGAGGMIAWQWPPNALPSPKVMRHGTFLLRIQGPSILQIT